ncbi:hypothetical protein [Pseudomonas putida]|uniref:DUF4760 domain-containing protein n=1 Tax=Pseudomonas putida TaxID=303 RepID=A0AAW4C109_PSEPU|nr:hypothetical protein [Pseudomonas putida]MBF8703869.1 hypothetical protein [Pseudomonas putida]MBF8738153.1 hypothetical protein [Pseudomonas putida]
MSVLELLGVSVVLVLVALLFCIVVFVLRVEAVSRVPEKISAICAFLTLLVAVSAAWVAWSQLQESKDSSRNQLQESKNSSAKVIYKEYISLAIDNPEFSAQSCFGGEKELKKMMKNEVIYEKYENYVAFLLFSAEQISMLTNYDTKWEQVLLAQLTYHALYLQSPDFQKVMMGFYSEYLQYLIRVSITNFSAYKCGP